MLYNFGIQGGNQFEFRADESLLTHLHENRVIVYKDLCYRVLGVAVILVDDPTRHNVLVTQAIVSVKVESDLTGL